MKNNYRYSLQIWEELPFLTDAERAVGEAIEAARRGETTWSTVLAQVETLEVLAAVYLALVESLETDFEKAEDPLDREVQLRLWVVLLHQMGRHWTAYRNLEQVEESKVEEWIAALQKADEVQHNALVWQQLLARVLAAKEGVEKLSGLNFIQEGMRVEICMIMEMLEPQQRVVFPAKQQWQTDILLFRKIETADQALLQRYFTSTLGQYLSIDSFAHPVLAQAYIRQSQAEMEQGTCLVLLAFERASMDFVGCLTLNDINQHTAEIGLWVAEEQQQKGYGTALLEQAIALLATAIPTKSIIYSVEKENEKSIALCEKHGFQLEKEFILEPTPLKNKYRSLLRYKKVVY